MDYKTCQIMRKYIHAPVLLYHPEFTRIVFFLSSVISIPEGQKISQKIPSAEENKPVLNGHTIGFPHIIKS